ncbi:MAG TPA: hypothetical protein VH682_13025 [Gemmataceae bacterium]|jgi:hypothetical protein
MREEEWLACADPLPMLEFLKGRVSNRKLRLFACACCRQGWRRLTNPYLRLAVETAEQYADNQTTQEELAKARAAAWSVNQMRHEHAIAAARATVRESAWAAAREAQQQMIQQIWKKVERGWATAPEEKKTSQRRQSDLLRCIIGDPFYPAAVDPYWLVWNNATIAKLASLISDERAFDRLPILADALEEAGCGNADFLNHCRQVGEHVRGCWVVDLILGKE